MNLSDRCADPCIFASLHLINLHMLSLKGTFIVQTAMSTEFFLYSRSFETDRRFTNRLQNKVVNMFIWQTSHARFIQD